MRAVVIGALALTALVTATSSRVGVALVLVVVTVVAVFWRAPRAITGHSHAGPLDRSARHEIGHALAIVDQGGTVNKIRLNRDGSGFVSGVLPTADPRAAVVVYLAGAEAAGTRRGADYDFDQIAKELDRGPSAERDRVLSQARRDVRGILSRRSGDLTRDAERLQGEVR